MKLSKNSIEYLLWIFEAFAYKKCGKYAKISYPHRVSGRKYISLGDNTKIGKQAWIEAIEKYENSSFSPTISLGDNVRIIDKCHIAAIDGISIGDNVLIASNVFISDHAHGQFTLEDLKVPPAKRELFSKGKIHIGNNVWIGEKVTILSGVTIGENSIIGANSVVTHDIPPNSVAVGAPAKVVKTL